MSCFFSVLVTVYNVEKYLKRNLDSILFQTRSDWEVILIDDGSRDNSGKICDEYVAKDKRFFVLHKQNEGVSIARQQAWKLAHGEYVLYVDADDWIEPQTLEILANCINDKQSDVIAFPNYYVNCEDRQTEHEIVLEDLSHEYLLKILITTDNYASVWSKAFKRSTLEKYNVDFGQKISAGEDWIFLIQLYQHDVKTSFISAFLYHYYDRPDNLSSFFLSPSYVSDEIAERIFNFMKMRVLPQYEDLILFKIEFDALFRTFSCTNKKINMPKKIYPHLYKSYKTSLLPPVVKMYCGLIFCNMTWLARFLFRTIRRVKKRC